MKSKKSFYNLVASLSYKVITCLVGILIPRLFIMNYGSELNGMQSSITQIFAYIGLIEAGVGEAALQALFAPISRNDRSGANGVLSAVTSYYNRIGVIYFGVLLGFAVLYPVFVPVKDVPFGTVVLYTFFAGAGTGVNFFYQAKILLVVQAEGDGYINFYLSLVVYLLSSLIKIACILSGLNIVYIQCGYFAVNMAVTMVYYVVAKRKYPWIDFHVKPNKEAIQQKNSVLVHKISGLVFHNVDIVLLTFFCGLEVVSVYSLYKLVINMITTVVASFSDSVNFVFGQTFNGGEKARYCQMIDAFHIYYSAIATALFTVAYFLLTPFLQLYTSGMDRNYVFEGLPLLYFVIELLQVGREAMLRTITVAGRFKDTIYSSLAEMIINVLVSIGAIVVFRNSFGNEAGIYGALIGTIVALLYRTFDINHFANVKILGRSAWKSNRIILICATIFSVLAIVMHKVSLPIGDYFSFVCTGAVLTIAVAAIYLVVLSINNPKEFRYVYESLKKLKKSK